MKSTYLFGLFVMLFFLSFLQITMAYETEQEPEPPKIPEPSPEPAPIKIPEPAPIPNPFPEESNSEKIRRLTEENDRLKQQNSNFQDQITNLKIENSRSESKILELEKTIQSLKGITMEQIRVIMDLVNRLKDISFEKIFSSIINL